MNRGTDFAQALAEAQGDTELRQNEFLARLSIAASSSSSRAVTAPGLRAITAGASTPTDRSAHGGTKR